MRYMKNGTPTTDITAPIGSSPTVNPLQNMSATSSISAPTTMLVGRRTRWSPPTTILQRCGTIRPTNPITPQNATQNAVSTEMRRSMFLLNFLASRPRYLAWSSPRSIMLSLRALRRISARMIATGMTIITALFHVMLEKLPNIHEVMFSIWSALNDMMSVVPALSPRPIIVPPRT